MADFHSWSKDSLVRFAEESTQRIAELEADLKTMQLAWRQALAQRAAPATLSEPTQGDDHGA